MVATSWMRKNTNRSHRVRESFKLWSQTVDVADGRRKCGFLSKKPHGLFDDTKEKKAMADTMDYSDSECESMTIQISIYSLSGLLIERKPAGRKGKRLPSKPIMDSSAFRAIVGANVARPNEGIHFRSFIPSYELEQVGSPKHDGPVPFTAYWGCDCQEDTDDPSRPLSTIEMTKQMKRIRFKRNIDLGRVAHFEHEHVDLQIAVGHGTEMILLGQASIAVSGEEESLVFFSIPVRQIGTTSGNRRQLVECFNFAADSGLSFTLAANATVRVGVRVVPSNVLPRRLSPRVASPRDVTGTLEFEDDDSLLSSFKSQQGSIHDKPDLTTILKFMSGCIELPMCKAEDAVVISKPQSGSRKSKEVTEAEVTPLHLLSDVSDSTYGSTDEEATDYE